MKKILFYLLVFLVSIGAVQAQDSVPSNSTALKWHLATEILSDPTEDSRAQTAYGHIDKYDTVPCKYKIIADSNIYKGYRRVFRKQGYYIDKLETRPNDVPEFFDLKKRPVTNVYSFCFVSSFE